MSATQFSALAQKIETEIFLLSYSIVEDKFQLESYSNVSNNAGYDNQPKFSEDGNKIYYSTMVDGKQTDIYEIDLVNKVRRAVTTSRESEYSPIPMKKNKLNFVSVGKDSIKRLFEFDLKSKRIKNKLNKQSSIGYYHWINEEEVALYITGDTSELIIYNVDESTYKRVATNVGRCFSLIPGTDELSFIDKSSPDEILLKSYNLRSESLRTIVPMLSGVEDYAWLEDNKIVVGSDGKLATYNLVEKGYWKIIADLKDEIGEFYRIDVSPSGKHLAVVYYEGNRP